MMTKTALVAGNAPWRRARAWTAAGAMVACTGCVASPGPRAAATAPGVPPPSPAQVATVVEAPAAAPVVPAPPSDGPISVMLIVGTAPPTPPSEPIPNRPTLAHVWVGGYWVWCNESYEWVPGCWMLPPAFNAVWTAPRWEREGDAYRFYAGSWN